MFFQPKCSEKATLLRLVAVETPCMASLRTFLFVGMCMFHLQLPLLFT